MLPGDSIHAEDQIVKVPNSSLGKIQRKADDFLRNSPAVILTKVYAAFARQQSWMKEVDCFGSVVVPRLLSELTQEELGLWNFYTTNGEAERSVILGIAQYLTWQMPQISKNDTLKELGLSNEVNLATLDQRLKRETLSIPLRLVPDISEEETHAIFGPLVAVDQLKAALRQG